MGITRIALASTLLLAGGLLSPLAAPAQDATPTACAEMTDAESAALATAYMESVNSGDFDAFATLIVPNAVYHSTVLDSAEGPEGFAGAMGELRTAFPDMLRTTDDVVSDGDLAFVRWSATGTNDGSLNGVDATGDQRTWTGMYEFRTACGQIVEARTAVDQAALLGLPGGDVEMAQSPDGATPAACVEMDDAAVRAAVERFWGDGWNKHDVDVYRDLVSDGVVHHWTSGEDTVGEDAGAERLQAFFTGIPDIEISWDDIAVDGDLAAASWTLKGLNTGDLFGRPATGRAIEYDGINVFRFTCGEMTEMWSEGDITRLQSQLSGS